MKLSKEFWFEAAHSLPHLSPSHKCSRLHGHSYRVVVWYEGEVDEPTGFVAGIDYADISHVFNAYVYEVLDHRFLNDIITPNTSAENVGIWIWKQIKPHMPQLVAVDVHETRSTCARTVAKDIK